ncbi:ABC transporter ATP-binding protein [Alkalihalobacillus hemicellulosilyticus]|uniref:Lipid A export ATP-binding/permease protein MsbA n=1 Tax=Halalkalibacter hemicellulosilyticusJCM 9152 TaxID=1236971 RepID=W4QDD0_9BACI|nr:ABC transporter ATP-binding protein [Halalkalibacter hemicellulosilyticus]GAE30055.1 lipid A export ATP-binding/permease protein MsbA [Halalkalibacter hemicellulosilyticusJCM 9152]
MDTFKRLKEFYWPFKSLFAWSLLALVVVTVMTVLYPMILAFTIDEAIENGRFELIPYLALTIMGTMIIKGGAVYVHQYLGDLFGIKAVRKLRDTLYEKLQFLPFRYYDNAKTGDLMSRLTADVEAFRFFLSFGCAQLLNIILLVGFSMSVMFYYSVPLTLVSMITIPFLAISVAKFDKRVHPGFRGIRKSLARLNTKVQENVSGMNTVKALSQEDEEITRFSQSNEDYRKKHIDLAKIWGRYFPLMEFLGNISAVILLAYGGYLTIQGSLQVGQLIAFFSLVWFIIGPIMQLGFIVNMFSQSKASGERLIEVLDESVRRDDAKKPVLQRKDDFVGEVIFNNVSLTYGAKQQQALKNISFEATKGKTIGLVGATGSGKSSIIQLITRFYERSSGDILIDGRSIDDYTLKELREQIGAVLQETFLFSSTIRDNIAYGRPNATMADIIDAAKRADAHEFIAELPDGYDTVLGERGLGLSGGQKQRIAIARSIIMDPRILILDDATSAVDMQTETKIQRAFQEVMKGRTTFVIAHRISSVKHADEILVLDQGEIIERGTHEELLRNTNGQYRRIYDIQNQDQEYVLQQV